MKFRLISDKNKTLGEFECADEESAKPIARKKGLRAMIGCFPSITIRFQKYSERIHDWIDFGEIKGCL